MVHLQMNGFIADNLFQYAAARLIAEELGYALRVSYSRLHPRRNVPQLLAFLDACADAPLELPGAVHVHPIDYGGHMDRCCFNGYYLDIAAFCARREPRRIELRGYFQHYDLIRPYKQRMRDWFAMSANDRGHNVSADDVVIHIRRCDSLVLGTAMSLQFYTELLQRMAFARLFIVGHELDGEVHRTFAPWQPVYLTGTPLDDFRFLLAAKRLLLSNSGFAWWAGFLSQAEEIHLPEMDRNAGVTGPKMEHANLWVDDEPRYHRVMDVPYRDSQYTLRDVYRARRQLRKKRVFTATRDLLYRRLRISRLPT